MTTDRVDNMIKIPKDHKLFGNWFALALIALAIYSLGCISGIAIVKKLSQATTSLRDSSITISSPDSEQVDRKIQLIVERQANAWETSNSNQIIADFTKDSLFIVHSFTFKGKQQIKEAAENYFAEFTDIKVAIKRIIANGNEVAVEWTWSDKNKKTGEKSYAEDAIVFELEEGKIKYWREYIDKQPKEN
ncbi:MAG: nuclear transport factor 2 family protein [Xenococcaceae cyanobacterium]